MTFYATDEVNIVQAGGGPEGSIHFGYVQSAVGEPRMAIGARSPSIQGVRVMAAQTSDSLMNSDGSSIVPGGHLKRDFRSMTLVAEALAGIRAERNGPSVGLHDRHGKHVNRKMSPLAAVIKSQRGNGNSAELPGPFGVQIVWNPLRLTLTVHLVAGQARDDGPISKIPVDQIPGALVVDGCHDVVDIAFNEHSMTT